MRTVQTLAALMMSAMIGWAPAALGQAQTGVPSSGDGGGGVREEAGLTGLAYLKLPAFRRDRLRFRDLRIGEG